MVLALAGQWWANQNRQATRHVLVQAGLAFFLGLSFNQITLLFIDRMRPSVVGVRDLLTSPSADPSYPSDHATAALAIAVTFAVSHMPKRALWFGVAALMVAFSRVYIGTHFASDVLGGALTGAIAAALLPLLYVRETRVDSLITNIF